MNRGGSPLSRHSGSTSATCVLLCDVRSCALLCHHLPCSAPLVPLRSGLDSVPPPRNTRQIANAPAKPHLPADPPAPCGLRPARAAGVAVALLLVIAAPAPAAELPPLRATLAGTLALRDLPPIAWEARAAAALPDVPDDARLDIDAKADGLVAPLSVRRDRATGTLSWELHSARADLAQWWRAVAARAGLTDLPADLEIAGELRVRGRGTLDPESFLPAGDAWAELDLPTVASTSATFRISDAQGRIHLGSLAPPRSAGEDTLTFREAEIAGVILRNGQARFRIEDLATLQVRGAGMEAFDGAVAVAPFVVRRAGDSLAPLSAEVSLTNASLAELAALLPEVVSGAAGRLTGRLGLRWSLAEGLVPARGTLALAPTAEATFRLQPQPGLLTKQLPERFNLLPAWLGPLSRWISAENPAYPVLRDIERGAMPLKVDTFDVQFLPDDPLGRTARVSISARPATPGPVEKVTFEINLSGPLEQVIRLGMDERVKIRTAP